MGTDIWDGVLPSCEALDEDFAGKMGGSVFGPSGTTSEERGLGGVSEGRVCSPQRAGHGTARFSLWLSREHSKVGTVSPVPVWVSITTSSRLLEPRGWAHPSLPSVQSSPSNTQPRQCLLHEFSQNEKAPCKQIQWKDYKKF